MRNQCVYVGAINDERFFSAQHRVQHRQILGAIDGDAAKLRIACDRKLLLIRQRQQRLDHGSGQMLARKVGVKTARFDVKC